MTSPYRAMCAELIDALENARRIIDGADGTLHINTAEFVLRRARAALAQPGPEVLTDEKLLEMAAAEMANSPNWVDPEYSPDNPFPYEAPACAWVSFARAAIAADRAHWGRPLSESEEPTADQLMDIACATALVYYMGEGCGFASPYVEEAEITAEVLAFAREVLARYGRSTSNFTEA